MSHHFRHVGDAAELDFSGVAVTGAAAEPDDLDGDPGIVLEYRDAPGDEPEPPTAELHEALAAYAHEAWSGWMRYQFERGGAIAEVQIEGENLQCWVMSPSSFKRWQRQMNTSYADLPESEKTSDRAEADKMLAIVGNTLTLTAHTTPRDAADMLRDIYTAEWIADLLVCLMSRTAGTESE